MLPFWHNLQYIFNPFYKIDTKKAYNLGRLLTIIKNSKLLFWHYFWTFLLFFWWYANVSYIISIWIPVYVERFPENFSHNINILINSIFFQRTNDFIFKISKEFGACHSIFFWTLFTFFHHLFYVKWKVLWYIITNINFTYFDYLRYQSNKKFFILNMIEIIEMPTHERIKTTSESPNNVLP